MGALMCLLVLPVVNKGASAVNVTTNPNGQGDLIIVGDSLLEGSTVFGNLSSRVTALRVWTSVGIDYKRGRRTSEAYGVVRSRLTAARNPTALVIALGTNDMISHSEPSWPARVISRMMTEANGLPVLWVNTTFNGAVHPDWRLRAVRFNRALRAAQKDWPNLFVADWFGYFVPKGPSRFIADGIHLSVSGYRTRATWMAGQIANFATAIVNATTTIPSTTSVPLSSSTTAPTSASSSSTTSTTTTPSTTSSTSTTTPVTSTT